MTALKDQSKVLPFMTAAKTPMSWGNNMGIGYSAIKSNGDMFTERWHDNDMFLDRESVMTQDVINQLEPFKKRLPNLRVNYSSQGEVDLQDVRSVTLHTRFATCGKEFKNTHPFVYEDTSLVHNGVINNHDKLGLNKISTCDSEAALQSYLLQGVNNDISIAQKWIDSLSGYWAFGIFSRDSSGRRILDIIRNDASLYATKIEGFGLVIATTEEIITRSAKEIGLELSDKISLMKSNVLYRFDAVTGERIDKIELTDSVLNRTSYSREFNWSSGDYENVFGKKKESSYPVDKSWTGGNYGKELKTSMKKQDKKEYTMLDKVFDMFDDIEVPLLERVELYDDTFDTEYADMLIGVPYSMYKDEWIDMDFFDTLDDIEATYMIYSGKSNIGG